MLQSRDSTAFRTLSDVVLALAAEREVEPVLQRLVHAARELAARATPRWACPTAMARSRASSPRG